MLPKVRDRLGALRPQRDRECGATALELEQTALRRLAPAARAPDQCWLLRAGVQPLQLAAATQGARRKHEETVSALLAGGADLNQRDNTGGTVSSAEITDM